MDAGPSDCFFIVGRREWEDGMALTGSATFWKTDCDDGCMVLEVEDEAGEGAVYVLPKELAAPLRSMHEVIFTGANLAGKVEMAVGAMMGVLYTLL